GLRCGGDKCTGDIRVATGNRELAQGTRELALMLIIRELHKRICGVAGPIAAWIGEWHCRLLGKEVNELVPN
ncbi:MAG: hypothetical protein ACXWCS_27470, partial [Burkholderiales bacterium]